MKWSRTKLCNNAVGVEKSFVLVVAKPTPYMTGFEGIMLDAVPQNRITRIPKANLATSQQNYNCSRYQRLPMAMTLARLSKIC